MKYWKQVRVVAWIGLLGGSLFTVSCSRPSEQAKPAAMPPGTKPTGAYLVFPPPAPWDRPAQTGGENP